MKPFDAENTAEYLTGFIKSVFEKQGFSRCVIGVSGGVDSATVMTLAARALGQDNVYPALMPYGGLGTQGVLDAMETVLSLAIPVGNIYRTDIKPAVDLICSREPVDQVRRGNVMARIRMIYLFDLAKKRQALVMGTENRSEHLLGYYTRFGDGASDIEPIRNVYKSRVYEIAAVLGIPEKIRTKPPSADLWASQTDASELGFTYQEADPVLEMIDAGKSEAEIAQLGPDPQITSKVLSRVRAFAYKTKLPLIPEPTVPG